MHTGTEDKEINGVKVTVSTYEKTYGADVYALTVTTIHSCTGSKIKTYRCTINGRIDADFPKRRLGAQMKKFFNVTAP